MSNLNQALYKMVTKYLNNINDDLETFINEGCTCFDLQVIKNQINHIQSMMDVVWGTYSSRK